MEQYSFSSVTGIRNLENLPFQADFTFEVGMDDQNLDYYETYKIIPTLLCPSVSNFLLLKPDASSFRVKIYDPLHQFQLFFDYAYQHESFSVNISNFLFLAKLDSLLGTNIVSEEDFQALSNIQTSDVCQILKTLVQNEFKLDFLDLYNNCINFIIANLNEVIRNETLKLLPSETFHTIYTNPAFNWSNTAYSFILNYLDEHPDFEKTFKLILIHNSEKLSNSQLQRLIDLLDDDDTKQEKITQIIHNALEKHHKIK